MGSDCSVETRVLRAFRDIDGGHGGPLIAVLRMRLLGELFGDADAVAATLDPAFELVMHTGGTTTTLPGSAVVQGVDAQAASGVLMWTEFDDLVTDNDVVAGCGLLCSLLLRERALTTMPVAVFLRFSGNRMNSEVAFMGQAHTEIIEQDALPDPDALRKQLDSEKDS
jgi:hypothetical protein